MNKTFRNIFIIVFLATVIDKTPIFSIEKSQAATIRCYPTGNIQVCHNTDDESIFYNTPIQEVAYYPQTIRNGLNYWTVVHTEARNKSANAFGDSIKVGSWSGSYNYSLPTNKSYKIWETQTDSSSILYSADGQNQYTSVSGGGNPMVVAGRHWAGDNFYYVFFLGVADDNMNRLTGENDYRHYLLEARTLDFVNFDMKIDNNGTEEWRPFNDSACLANPVLCRPKMLKDVNGNVIRSNHATHPMETQGLIGSVLLVNNIYYYFYTDYDTSSQNFYLYYRTATDVTGNNYWSAPTRITQNDIRGPAIVRVTKAKGLDRWAALYNCWNPIGQSDLCLQYTNNLNIVGPGGISELAIDNLNSGNFYLGLKGPGLSGSVNQQGLLTDKEGNLISPDAEDQAYTRGGELRWSDFSSPGVYGGRVWRGGWTVSLISTPDTTLPTVSLTAPANNATVSGTSTTINATAVDNVGVAGVQFKLDGVNLGAEDTTSPYSIVWNTTTTTNAAHTLTAVARDAAGNTATSTATTVTVNNPAPITPTLSTGSSVQAGNSINVSWSNIADPTANNWVGLYFSSSSPDASGLIDWSYLRPTAGTCLKSTTGASTTGTCSFTVPANTSTGSSYEFRLFSSNAVKLTTSNSFVVVGTSPTPTPTLTPTLTPTPTPTVTLTPTPLITPTPTPTPTPSSTPTPTPTIPPAPSGYVFCAFEYNLCSFSGTKNVKYGANGVFIARTLSDGTNCSNSIFGDPLIGVLKACFIQDIVSTPTPTPIPTPTPTPTPVSTPTPTVTPISTPIPSLTPAPTPSIVPTPTLSVAPTPTVIPTPTLPSISPPPVPTPTMIPEPVTPAVSVVRFQSDPRVYQVLTGNRLKWIPTPEVFNQLGISWSQVNVRPVATQSQYTRTRFMRASNDPKVYYITEGGLKRWIPNEQVFLSYNNSWQDIVIVTSLEINAVPDNILVGVFGDERIYKLEKQNGIITKRWITTADAFNRNGFKWNQTASINQTELNYYPTGQNID